MNLASALRRSCPALLGLVLLAGCPGDDDISTSEATETGMGDGDGDPVGDGDGDPPGDGDGDPSGDGDGEPEGECYDISDQVSPPSAPNCMLPTPCADAEFVSGDCEVSATYDPAVGQCILDALAAGDPASVRVRDCPGGQFSESWSVQVLGDGTGIWRRANFQDIGGEGRVTWRALPEASYYEDCSAETPDDLVACIVGLVAGECQLGEPVCPG